MLTLLYIVLATIVGLFVAMCFAIACRCVDEVIDESMYTPIPQEILNKEQS